MANGNNLTNRSYIFFETKTLSFGKSIEGCAFVYFYQRVQILGATL